MSLDRKTVDETAGKHIRMMTDGGYKTAEQKDAIRREHARIARMVEQKARKRR